MVAKDTCASLLVEQMPTVAEQLRQKREALNLDIAQVAEATKLKSDHIRALEEGDYECFTAAVYLRGSLRTYANLLKLDATKLLAELDAEQHGTGSVAGSAAGSPPGPSPLDGVMLQLSRLRWGAIGVVLALAVVVFGLTAVYRSWRDRRAADPLKALGPGLYEPKKPVADLLPLPTNTIRSAP
jgi:cytoskeletal protein RodZ